MKGLEHSGGVGDLVVRVYHDDGVQAASRKAWVSGGTFDYLHIRQVGLRHPLPEPLQDRWHHVHRIYTPCGPDSLGEANREKAAPPSPTSATAEPSRIAIARRRSGTRCQVSRAVSIVFD